MHCSCWCMHNYIIAMRMCAYYQLCIIIFICVFLKYGVILPRSFWRAISDSIRERAQKAVYSYLFSSQLLHFVDIKKLQWVANTRRLKLIVCMDRERVHVIPHDFIVEDLDRNVIPYHATLVSALLSSLHFPSLFLLHVLSYVATCIYTLPILLWDFLLNS